MQDWRHAGGGPGCLFPGLTSAGILVPMSSAEGGNVGLESASTNDLGTSVSFSHSNGTTVIYTGDGATGWDQEGGDDEYGKDGSQSHVGAFFILAAPRMLAGSRSKANRLLTALIVATSIAG